jgi:glycyl-tRNA synthetase
LDSSNILHRKVLQKSGHEDTFTDPLLDCLNCKKRQRADHLINNKCAHCDSQNLTEPREFNLMLKTQLGPVNKDDNFSYLRPETAQGIFVNYKNILSSTNQKVPFGIAQIGKAFRNEITPRHFIFRVREFTQMELEFFVEQDSDEKWFEYWVENRKQWWLEQGVSKDKIYLKPQDKDELAHYSKKATDIMFSFPHGEDELEGIANRTDYDLNSHFLKMKNKPNVIEPSAGLERGMFAILSSCAVKETTEDNKTRLVLKLKPHLAPVKAAIIPLAKNNSEIVNLCHSLLKDLLSYGYGRIRYEDTGNIGKAYSRNDEIGTPYCITVDFDSIDKSINTVTIRERDSKAQETIPLTDIKRYFDEKFPR